MVDEQAALIALLEAGLAQIRAQLAEHTPTEPKPSATEPKGTRHKTSEHTRRAILADLAASFPQKEVAARQGVSVMTVWRQARAIEAAAARFADVEVALAEGYIPDPSGHCVSAEAEGLPAEWGGMGLHYIHPGRLGIAGANPRVDGTGLNTDFLAPSILLYEPQADGSLVLVGVENLVFEAAWRAAGNADAPTFGERGWDYMADDPATPGDEAHGFMPHWDQHVWFRDNPSGDLMPFNPAVTCEHHAHDATH